MRAPYAEAQTNIVSAGDAILGIFGIDVPTQRQRIGATLIGEFLVKAINFIPAPKR
jgi:hypothetical protein